MTNKEEQEQKQNENKIPFHNNLHKKAGFLPPQALPTPPPPPPIPNEDTSSLTSPWWSEETAEIPNEELNEHKDITTRTTVEVTNEAATTTTTTTTNSEKSTITLLGFGRSSKTKGEWNEKCYMLATTQGEKTKEKNFDQEFKRLTEQSKNCSMICFLRESKKLTKQRREQEYSFWDDYNPFFGTWITVTRTPSKCRQHLETEYIQKKNINDYYTMELGDGLSYSGEYVKNAILHVFGPLHRLGVRYIDSWKNGNQQAFFTRFTDSLKRGDGIFLVRDSTKRLIENALGEKKQPPNDNKNK